MAGEVFISYSRQNSAFVNRLRSDLQSRGIRVWIDHERLTPGTPDWEEAIRRAIRSVQAVLFIASPDSRKSPYVRDELRVAEMNQRTVYPIWAEGRQWMDCVPMGWGGIQYTDARGSNYSAALQSIVRALGGSPVPVPATSSGPYDLSRLQQLLAAQDWNAEDRYFTAADRESMAIIRSVTGITDKFDSMQKVSAIPSDLLVAMDKLWRDATGRAMYDRAFTRGVSSFTSFVGTFALDSYLGRRLKELGLDKNPPPRPLF